MAHLPFIVVTVKVLLIRLDVHSLAASFERRQLFLSHRVD